MGRTIFVGQNDRRTEAMTMHPAMPMACGSIKREYTNAKWEIFSAQKYTLNNKKNARREICHKLLLNQEQVRS